MLACLAVLFWPSAIAHVPFSSSSANAASEQDTLTHQAAMFSTDYEQMCYVPDRFYDSSRCEFEEHHADVIDVQFRGPWIPSGYETKDAQILDALEIFYWQHYVSTSDLLSALGELEGFFDRSSTENITLISKAITYVLSLIDFPFSAVRTRACSCVSTALINDADAHETVLNLDVLNHLLHHLGQDRVFNETYCCLDTFGVALRSLRSSDFFLEVGGGISIRNLFSRGNNQTRAMIGHLIGEFFTNAPILENTNDASPSERLLSIEVREWTRTFSGSLLSQNHTLTCMSAMMETLL